MCDFFLTYCSRLNLIFELTEYWIHLARGVSEPYMRIKTVTPSFPPNIFWGEAARLVWTWWASELVCVTWVADTSSCWSILIWVAPPGEERATEHTFSNYPRFAGPAFQRGAVCEVGGWRQAVNSKLLCKWLFIAIQIQEYKKNCDNPWSRTWM